MKEKFWVKSEGDWTGSPGPTERRHGVRDPLRSTGSGAPNSTKDPRTEVEGCDTRGTPTESMEGVYCSRTPDHHSRPFTKVLVQARPSSFCPFFPWV